MLLLYSSMGVENKVIQEIKKVEKAREGLLGVFYAFKETIQAIPDFALMFYYILSFYFKKPNYRK